MTGRSPSDGPYALHTSGRRLTVIVLLIFVAAVVVACGSSRPSDPNGGIPRGLLAQARPIGRGTRFHPPLSPDSAIIGGCRSQLGPRYGVHVELFAENRVVLIAAGIGTHPPRTVSDGRVSRARCYGALVTLDPTGLVLVRTGSRLRLSDLFRAWGRTLSERQLVSFAASPGTVTVFVDGRREPGSPGDVRLIRHAEDRARGRPARPAAHLLPVPARHMTAGQSGRSDGL